MASSGRVMVNTETKIEPCINNKMKLLLGAVIGAVIGMGVGYYTCKTKEGVAAGGLGGLIVGVGVAKTIDIIGHN